LATGLSIGHCLWETVGQFGLAKIVANRYTRDIGDGGKVCPTISRRRWP